jgi:hypothetical protein
VYGEVSYIALHKSFPGTLPQWLFLQDFEPVTERKKKPPPNPPAKPSLHVAYKGWQALNQSLQNVPTLTTVRPHLTLAHAANAFTEVGIRFVAAAYTHRPGPKSFNDNLTIVFIH